MPIVRVFEDELSSQELVRRAQHRLGITDISIAVEGDSGLKIFDRMDGKPDLVLCIFSSHKIRH